MCLTRLRRLIEALPPDRATVVQDRAPARTPSDLYQITGSGTQAGRSSNPEYDVRDVLACLLDAGPFDEYKADYGQTLVCGYGRLGGVAVGVVANPRKRCRPAAGPIQFGGVIYVDSADKAARFIMDCNQTRLPILFLQDVNGFMVGRDSEQAGIIKAGAKLVNVIANSVVPKITLILGGSFGAGNYALCGKAFDPRFIFAWPTARYAVMGGEQAASTLLDIAVKSMRRDKQQLDAEELEQLRQKVEASYEAQTDVRYAAARLWIDAIVAPARTRATLLDALEVATRFDDRREFRTGVLQV
jgi:acetyl-CoA carboxylase carboxyltransferase component